MRPSGLKKENGIPSQCLNGLECLREMAGIAEVANCGPLLQDAYLLERIGFAAEKVQRRLTQDRTIIDPETLPNHLGRFTEADLEAGFLRRLGIIRQKRWLRGGLYAVDGHDIRIPFGKGQERATRIAEGSYGYKLLVRLSQTLGPLRERLKILLLDRGYWGTDLFCELKQDYGVDFLSRVRDEKLDINGSIQRQLAEPGRTWSRFQEQRQFAGRGETQWVRTTAWEPIRLISDEAPHRQIAVHVVVAEQTHADGTPIRDKQGRDISTTCYVTSLRPGTHGVKVRRFYRNRWSVENQGFRPLSQTWEIDRPGTATQRCWRGWCSCS